MFDGRWTIRTILFGGTGIAEAKLARLRALRSEVEQYPSEEILKVNVDDLVEFYVRKYRLEVPTLYFEKKTIVDSRELNQGVQVTLSIPFEGRPEVFSLRPMATQGGSQDAEITVSDLQIRFSGAQRSVLTANIERTLSMLEFNLNSASRDLRNFDEELRGQARLAINQRREQLHGKARLVESLGIPILRRAESPPVYPAVELRRKPPVATPPVADVAPDPTVELAEYEHILNIISNMVQVMERSPRTFAHMDEQALRDIILVNLNGHYEGQATGETFNFEGKTDILVHAKGGNIFVAECKFWHGKKAYLDAITQLLGYVTWRDTKTALIVFNRLRNFSLVVNQISDITKEHPSYKSGPERKADTAFRFTLKNMNDSEREVLMTVLAFDVPS